MKRLSLLISLMLVGCSQPLPVNNVYELPETKTKLVEPIITEDQNDDIEIYEEVEVEEVEIEETEEQLPPQDSKESPCDYLLITEQIERGEKNYETLSPTERHIYNSGFCEKDRIGRK